MTLFRTCDQYFNVTRLIFFAFLRALLVGKIRLTDGAVILLMQAALLK